MANQASLENFDRALTHIRAKLRPMARLSREEVIACVSPHESAKLNVAVAYGLSSLFYMYLKTQGVAPAEHPVRNELGRIQEYVKRLNAAQGKVAPSDQRKLVVDREAGRRFIENALAGDEVYRSAKGSGGGSSVGEDGASSGATAAANGTGSRSGGKDSAAANGPAAAKPARESGKGKRKREEGRTEAASVSTGGNAVNGSAASGASSSGGGQGGEGGSSSGKRRVIE